MVFANFQAQVKNDAGDDVDSPEITVRREIPGLPLATIYADNAGDTPLANPFTADADGYFRFYAEGGFYRITATSGAFSRTWFDVAIGNRQAEDAGDTSEIGRRTITGSSTVTLDDLGGIIEMTSGGGTLSFDSAATLGSGFDVTIVNSSDSDLVLDPASTELIDGLSTWTLYPGGAILVSCDGATFESILLSPMRKQFDTSGTFVKPGVGKFAFIEGWGGGGSGGRAGATDGGGGGGGGAHYYRDLALSQFGTTETVTIGAGGASRTSDNQDGAVGGTSTVGGLFSVFGGGGGGGNVGDAGGGGGGGGAESAGSTAAATSDPADGGGPIMIFWISDNVNVAVTGVDSGREGCDGGGGSGGRGDTGAEDGIGDSGGYAAHGGGGGGGGGSVEGGAGGGSLHGGGGGGGGGGTTAVNNLGGTSAYGGNGGRGQTGSTAATAGTAPGGGGGGSESGNSGAGAAGRIIIKVW